MRSICIAAVLAAAMSTAAYAAGEWPEGPNKLWSAQDLFGIPVDSPDTKKKQWPDGPLKDYLEKLQRPDTQLYGDISPLSCCGAGDVVETKFKVEPGNEKYPEDTWYAWLDNAWVRIPSEKIVPDHAPDGQAYLFVLQITGRNGSKFREIVCFVRPKGGI